MRIKNLCNENSVGLNPISRDGNDNDNDNDYDNAHQDKF